MALFGREGLFGNVGNLFFGKTPKDTSVDAGMPYFNQIPGVANNAYDPYILSGKQAQGITDPIYKSHAQNPDQFINDIMGKYNSSTGFNFKKNQMMGAAQNSAAQGGYAGTPFAQEEQNSLLQGLLGQDMQQFMQNYMDVQGRGLSGLEQRVERGYGASGNKADMLASNLSQQAGLAVGGARQNAQHQMDRQAALMQFVSNLATGGKSGWGPKQTPEEKYNPGGGSNINFLQRGSTIQQRAPMYAGAQRAGGNAFGSYEDYRNRR